jgi:hypothetical protein
MRLFVNVYSTGVGGCIGYGYALKSEAENSKSGNRLKLIEMQDVGDTHAIAREFLTGYLQKNVRDYFVAAAQKRNADPAALCAKVLSTIAQDDMLKAILDDGKAA